MKKFRLKPLGELRHKFNMTWFFVSLVMALGVSACSDDDDDDIVPTFPEKQTINSNGNETRELAFDAAANWQLTSSAAWCRFMVDGVEEYSLSGNAGKQNITIQITDEAQKFDARTTAQLTLTMGNTKAIIADVVRNAKGREMKIYDLDGNEIDKIKIGYKDYNSFVVKANFHFAATNRPEWVNIAGNAIVGSVSDKNGVVGKVKIIDDVKYVKYQQEGKITFADDEGLSSFDFPIVFDGMDRKDINISGPTNNVWDWTVSLDGKTFSQGGGSATTTSSTTYRNSLPFAIEAYNDQFTSVYIEETNGQFIANIVSDWMKLEGKEGNMRLVIEPSEQGERIGYVLVFPSEIYSEIENNLIDNIIEDGEIKYEYEQKYLLLQFTQKDKKNTENEEQFTVVDGTTTQKVECTEYTGADAKYFKDEYGVSTIYEIKQPVKSNNINPLFAIANFNCYYLDDENVAPGICEQFDESTVNAYLDGVDRDLFVTIYDAEGNGKMMIIRATNQGNGGNDGEQVFVVKDNEGGTVECTAYSGFDIGYFKETYGVNAIYEIKNPVTSMFVEPASFDITEYQCLYFEDESAAPDDICALPDGESLFNMWIEGIEKDIFVVISNGEDQKYMIIVRINS